MRKLIAIAVALAVTPFLVVYAAMCSFANMMEDQ